MPSLTKLTRIKIPQSHPKKSQLLNIKIKILRYMYTPHRPPFCSHDLTRYLCTDLYPTKICARLSDWLRLTKESSSVQPCLQWRIPGFFPEQQLVIEPTIRATFKRDLKQSATVTATRTPQNKRFNEQDNGCACAF